MKTTIRRGVFETNSSSVHTLTIAANTNPNIVKKRYLADLIIFVSEAGEYGWSNTMYTDFQDKLDYLVQAFTYASTDYYSDNRTSKEDSLAQTLAWRQQLKDFLAKYDITLVYENSKVVWKNLGDDYKYWMFVPERSTPEEIEKTSMWSRQGYIDHGAEAREFVIDVMGDETKLFNFLFDNHSVIITGNDNQDYEDFITVPDYEYIDVYEKGN